MARSTLLAALVATVVLAGASSGVARQSAPKSLPGSPVFVISGRGWGHGVGMAQWGAYGYAQHGSTFQQILAHYYPGTQLTIVDAATNARGPMRVLLDRDVLTISPEELKDTKVVWTMLGGVTVYRAQP